MRFRLLSDLPLQARVAGAEYVIELVHGETSGEYWLRARDRHDPVVFLLARFRDEREAIEALAFGFEVVPGTFPQLVFEALLALGVAQRCRVPAPVRPHFRVVEPEPDYALAAG